MWEINLGSIGKGYALDRAGELLRDEWQISSVLLQGGHSSVLAMGCQPGEERGWPVGVRHPWNPDVRLGVVYLKDRALGTSAATHKHLEYNGRKLGHVTVLLPGPDAAARAEQSRQALDRIRAIWPNPA